MTVLRLAARTLAHRWGLSFLTIFCLAIASSVLLGAFLVGHSMRSSLSQRLVEPLGPITHAYVSRAFLPPERIQTRGALVIRLEGSVQNQQEQTEGGVTCWGIDESFLALMGSAAWRPAPGRAWITQRLAEELRLSVGDPLFLRVPDPSALSTQAVFARKSPIERTIEIRAEVGAILPESGLARFDLTPTFQSAKAVFVPRAWLAVKLKKIDGGNVALGPSSQLTYGMTLADHGLSLHQAKRAGGWVLQSDDLVLSDEEVSAARKAGGGKLLSIALADRYAIEDRSGSYGVAAWIEGEQPGINEWALKDLAAQLGKPGQASLLVTRPDGSYGSCLAAIKLSKIHPMTYVGGEPAFVPNIKGVTDAAKVNDWDPPFPLNHKRITARDEEYWRLYRAAPRLFLSREDLTAAWNGRESITGVWFRKGSPAEIEKKLLRELDRILPGRTADLKSGAIKAAEGSTDMTSLILALGFFLMLGALGLAGSAFRLVVRQEEKSIVLLSALGVTEWTTRSFFLAQGMILGAAGSALGLAGGIGFAGFSLMALRLLMPAVFSSGMLDLKVDPILCASALAGSLAFALWPLAAGWKEAQQLEVIKTLRGGDRQGLLIGRSKGTVIWCLFGILAAAGTWTLASPGKELVFGFGLFALSMGALGWMLGRPVKQDGGITFAKLAWRFARESRSSLLLSFFLSGMAAFMLSAVASQIKQPQSGDNQLILRTTLPLGIDLGSPEGRKKLGFEDDELRAAEGIRVLSFLVGPGQDASCLNPAKPAKPRFIGLPRETALAEPFAVNPKGGWQALAARLPQTPSPALGDHETVLWTLMSGLGKIMPWEREKNVKFAGLIEESPLAREIMVSQADFQAAYPAITSPSLFLITPPKSRDPSELIFALKSGLASAGPQVTSVQDELAALRSVQNAYMALFFTLGAMGLILGVAGAAFSSAREAAARRQQYALMSAIGLRSRSLTLLALLPGALAGLGGTFLGILCGGPALLRPESATALGVLFIGSSLSVGLASLWVLLQFRWDTLTASLRSE